MGLTTPQLRAAWQAYECAPDRLVFVDFGPDRIRVAPPTAEAWRALATVLAAHDYSIRTGDTDSYNCRQITGGSGRSLHSYGIALDVNWDSNPYIDHAGARNVRYSPKATQSERAADVRAGRADTDMTAAMIADVSSIKARNGKRVFEWGGNWTTVKDCMHFELDLAPADLAGGIDWSTVVGGGGAVPGGGGAATPVRPADAPPVRRLEVIARRGLNLREGPGTDFAIVRQLPAGTIVTLLRQEGAWALLDLEGDGRADGHAHASFLRAL